MDNIPQSWIDDPNPNWCIYDMSDDAIIVTGKWIEMYDLIDTMAGNLHITTTQQVETYRQTKQNQ